MMPLSLTESDYRKLIPIALYDFYVSRDIYEGPYTRMILSSKMGRRYLVESLFSGAEDLTENQTSQRNMETLIYLP